MRACAACWSTTRMASCRRDQKRSGYSLGRSAPFAHTKREHQKREQGEPRATGCLGSGQATGATAAACRVSRGITAGRPACGSDCAPGFRRLDVLPVPGNPPAPTTPPVASAPPFSTLTPPKPSAAPLSTALLVPPVPGLPPITVVPPLPDVPPNARAPPLWAPPPAFEPPVPTLPPVPVAPPIPTTPPLPGVPPIPIVRRCPTRLPPWSPRIHRRPTRGPRPQREV